MFLPIIRACFFKIIFAASIVGLLANGAHASSVVLRGHDPFGTHSFGSAVAAPNGWNNDAAPSAGNDYSTGPFQMRTPAGTAPSDFAGASLSIDSGGSLLFKGSGIYTVNNLILNGGALLHGDTAVAPPNNIATLAGIITVNAPSSIDTTSAVNRIITINSMIHGSGGLTISGTNGAVNFTNTGSDFAGSLTLAGSSPLVVPSVSNGGIPGAMGAASANAANLVFNGGRLRINGGATSSTDHLFTLRPTGGTIESAHTAAAVGFTNSGPIVLEGSGSRTLTLAGVSNGANTLAPVIGDKGGPTTVTKIDGGTWELTGANTYTGATNINGGTLAFSNLNNLGSGPALKIGAGNLRWNAGNTVDISTARTVTFTTGNAGLNTGGQDITLAGVIGGAGGLTKLGGGALTLSGANTFSGDVTLNNNSGPVRITNSQALGVGAKTVSITGNQGGANVPSLILNGGVGSIVLPSSVSFVTSNDGLNTGGTPPALLNEAGDNTINGNFILTAGGGGTRYLVNAGSLTLNGTITPASGQSRVAFFAGAGDGGANGVLQNSSAGNALSVIKEGSGIWHLNGANAYTGTTLVREGTLITNTASTGGGVVTVSSGANLGVRVAAPGQTFTTPALTLNSGSTELAFDLGTFGNPTVPVIATPSFNPNSTVGLIITGTNLSTGTPIPLVDYGTIGGNGFAALSLTLPVRANGSLVDNAADGRVDLLLTSIDFPRWTGVVDGNWNASVQNWREVKSGNPTAYLQGARSSHSDHVLFDDDASGTTNVNLATVLTPASVTVNNAGKDYVFTGSGRLSGSTGLLKQGAGKLTLANTGGNDYAGVTTINAGTLQIGDGATAGAGQLGVGPVVNNGVLIFNRPDDFSVSNLISGSGSITKNGSGVLTVQSNNTFSGSLTVNGGNLVVNGSISGSSTAVENDGTLSGDGFIGPAVVRAGGTLASDANLVPIHAGPLVFETNSRLRIEINGATTDGVTVAGNVTLSGAIALNIEITDSAVEGVTYTLLNSTVGINGYAGGARFSYAGNSLEEGERFSVTSGLFSQDFTISYVADGGKDVVLTAVPEPGSSLLLSSAVVLGGVGRVRRRQR